MLLYNIQLQYFLLRLEDVLPGVCFLDFEEQVEAYVDDVVAVLEAGPGGRSGLWVGPVNRISSRLSGVTFAPSLASTVQTVSPGRLPERDPRGIQGGGTGTSSS
jgi:hypothetical protein